MMHLRLLTDLRLEDALKRQIAQRLFATLSPQEHTLDDEEAKKASITALLDTLSDRCDLALVACSVSQSLACNNRGVSLRSR